LAPSPARVVRLAALIVIVAIAAVYVQALGGGFLWDDRLLIMGVPLVERTASLSEYLRHPFWMGMSGARLDSYYRPLVTLSFALDHRLHGDNPAGYHLTNFLFHELNALLLLALLRRFGVRPLAAALLAAGWALLPRLAEAAAWVSGRTDLIAGSCLLGALLAWGHSPWRRVTASVLVLAGLLAKESALAAVVALAVLEWTSLQQDTSRKKLYSVATRLWPVAISVFAYVLLRASAVGLHTNADRLGATLRAETVFDTVTTYALMLVDMLRPRALIGRLGLVRLWGVVAGAVIVCACMLVALRRRGPWQPSTSVGLALAFAAVFPVLHVIPLPVRVLAADRFLYLPTAGLALALGPRLDAWLALHRARWLALVGVLMLLGVVTSRRVGVWSDELEFWVQTYLETPVTNSSAATNLAGVFFRAGQYEDVLELSRRELRYDEVGRGEGLFNGALALSRLGRKEEARAQLLSIDAKHYESDVAIQIAIIELESGHFDAGRARLDRLVRGGDAQAREVLERVPDLIRALTVLERVPETDASNRARLASIVGNENVALRSWLKAASDPNVSKDTLHEALSYLVRTGNRDAIASVARRYVERFGAIDSKLASIVSLRLDEIDRVRAVRPRLRLGG